MRGGEIWDVAAYADPDQRVPAGPPFLGPESTRLIVHAIREADRLGLELGLVASSGWNAGGSWITPEHAGKGLYHSTTTVNGTHGVFTTRCHCPNCRRIVRVMRRAGQATSAKWRCWRCLTIQPKTIARWEPGH